MTGNSTVRWPLLLALVLATACVFDPAAPPEYGPRIEGIVLDADGNPAAGVPVGLIYGVSEWLLPGHEPDGWNSWNCDGPIGISIGFALPEPSTVDLRVLDWTHSVVQPLITNQLLPAGEHSFSWLFGTLEGGVAANGLYYFWLKSHRGGETRTETRGPFLINRLCLDYDSCVGPAAITDERGRFFIRYADLPLGVEVDLYGGETATIPDSLWIQAAQGATQARMLIRIEDRGEDLPVTLQLD